MLYHCYTLIPIIIMIDIHEGRSAKISWVVDKLSCSLDQLHPYRKWTLLIINSICVVVSSSLVKDKVYISYHEIMPYYLKDFVMARSHSHSTWCVRVQVNSRDLLISKSWYLQLAKNIKLIIYYMYIIIYICMLHIHMIWRINSF